MLASAFHIGYQNINSFGLSYKTISTRTRYTGEEGSSFYKGSLDLIFPIAYGLKVNLWNHAIFRGLSGALFIENSNISNTGMKQLFETHQTTIGTEVSFLFSALFDITLPITIGYSWDLNSEQELFYFNFSSPINLYNVIFGY